MLRQYLGLDPNADAAAVLAALKDKGDAIKSACAGAPAAVQGPYAASRTVVDALDATVRALSAKITERDAKIAEYAARDAAAAKATVASRVESLLATGYPESMRATLLDLAQTAPATFDALASTMRPPIPVAEVAAPPSPAKSLSADPTLTEDEEKKVLFFVRSGVKRPDAIRQVKAATAFINSRRG